jgi:hypothetical protein
MITTLENKTQYLYRHIRPDTNEVFYVGIGKTGSNRATESRRRTDLWAKVVTKNNGEYKVDIIFENLTMEEASIKEKEFITLYGKKIDNTGTLVNFQNGGSHHNDWRMSPEQREVALRNLRRTSNKGKKWDEARKLAFSLSRKGRKNPYKGKTLPKEWSDNLSKGHLGNLSNTGKFWINNGVASTLLIKGAEIPEGFILGRLGWKLSQETKDRYSKQKKGVTFNLTPEQRERKSASMKGNKSCSGMIWFTDGTKDILIKKDLQCPIGFYRGRTRTKKINNN